MFSGTDGTWQELDAKKIVNFERVFNALTDNGKQEGIYMQNGHLYINASYIKSGQISADLINLKNINVINSSGTSTFAIDNYGNVTLRPDTFVLTNGDTIYSVAEDKASTALSSANSYTDKALSDLDIGKMSKQEIIDVLSDNSSNKGLYLSNGNVYMNADYINTGELAGWKVGIKKLSASGAYGEVTLDASTGEIYSETNTGVYVPGYGTLYGTRLRPRYASRRHHDRIRIQSYGIRRGFQGRYIRRWNVHLEYRELRSYTGMERRLRLHHAGGLHGFPHFLRA
jgi:hypothetical protein